MFRPTGSWVAMPTPFNKDGSVDYEGFKVLIDRQIKYGTSELFIMGSAGEATLLTKEERREIVKQVVRIADGRIPVFFGAGFPTTQETVEFSQYCEEQGADGLIYTAPIYLLLPQTAVYDYLRECMMSVSIPVGVYNNPARLGVNVDPATIKRLADEIPNFIVMKEATGDVSQIMDTKELMGDRLNILCCDFPKYSIVLPTLAAGGNGTANIGGNIIPEEVALFSRPWDTIEKVEESRDLYLKYFPLLKALYWFTNPIVIKAALEILGLPSGGLRRPHPELQGRRLDELIAIMDDLGVIEKYGQ